MYLNVPSIDSGLNSELKVNLEIKTFFVVTKKNIDKY